LKIIGSVFILLFVCQIVAAQWIVGVQYTGLAFHPKLYRGKLDRKGHFVMNGGLSFSASYFVNKNVGFRVNQTVMPQDCGGKWFGASQAGVVLRKDFTANDTGLLTMGPIFFYRQNWADLPDYQDDSFFRKSKNQRLQYKFVWHGGHVEYTRWLNGRSGVTVNLLPGIPEIFELSTGMSFRNN
jgi:hypothetical protein